MSAGRSARAAPGESPVAGALLHDERLWPSASTWLLVVLFAVMFGAVAAAFGRTSAIVGGLIGVAVTVVSLVNASARVQVSTEGGLRAGRARVPARFLAGAVAGRGETARQLRGPLLDARSYLCLRGWVDGVVLVQLDDPDDPTPAWLVSSRRPEELRAAVQQVQPPHRQPAHEPSAHDPAGGEPEEPVDGEGCPTGS